MTEGSLTDGEIAELRKLDAAADPAPWEQPYFERNPYGDVDAEHACAVAARNALPRLLDEVVSLRARLVEVERERDGLRLEAKKALDFYASAANIYNGKLAAAESRASAAESALRELVEVLRRLRVVEFGSPNTGRILAETTYFASLMRAAEGALALSGLPPLADAPRVAQPTPAALVPKEAATPKAIAGTPSPEAPSDG